MEVSCSELLEQLFKKKFPEEAKEQSKSVEQDQEESKKVATLRDEIKRLKRKLTDVQGERDTAAELFFGFAKSQYKYDPAKKNMSLSEMIRDLENAGVQRGTGKDTIDKYLDIGFQKNSRKPA